MPEQQATKATALVRVDGLGCRRGGRQVFEGISFGVEAGGALVLRGPNGSGKSTLLRVLSGLLPAATGSVAYGSGEDSAELHYVGHADATKPALTVEENLAFVAAMLGGGDVEAGLRAFALLRLADSPARHLSSGQRRRLTLARLAAVSRPLWLLDEPGVGLDAQNRSRLETLVTTHRANGGAVVVATHGDIAIDDATVVELTG